MDPYYYVSDSTGKTWVIRRDDGLVMCECTDTTRASVIAVALNTAA